MGNPNTYVGILNAEFVRVRFTYNHAFRIFRGIYVISLQVVFCWVCRVGSKFTKGRDEF